LLYKSSNVSIRSCGLVYGFGASFRLYCPLHLASAAAVELVDETIGQVHALLLRSTREPRATSPPGSEAFFNNQSRALIPCSYSVHHTETNRLLFVLGVSLSASIAFFELYSQFYFSTLLLTLLHHRIPHQLLVETMKMCSH